MKEFGASDSTDSFSLGMAPSGLDLEGFWWGVFGYVSGFVCFVV